MQANRAHAAHCISEYTETRAKTPALPFSFKTAILFLSSPHSGFRAFPERLCNFRLYIVEGGVSRHNARDKIWPQFVNRLGLQSHERLHIEHLTLFAQFVQRFRMTMQRDTAFVGTCWRIAAAGAVKKPAGRTTDDVTLSHYPLHRRAFGVLVGDPLVERPSRSSGLSASGTHGRHGLHGLLIVLGKTRSAQMG